ncbi:MAG: phosphate ABC transporter ATP-binding protein [Chloroflexota bacterium]|nr:phosphate ABC transporter ATP-binding protein [Chloroflexota bacterium]
MMQRHAGIRVRDLNIHYGSLHVLKNLSVDVPTNQITAVIGPSGCGKTTFLKSINRLIDLTQEARVSGNIMVDSIQVLDPGVDVTEVRQRIGLLAQRPYPLPMSIYENVAFGPRIHGLCNGRSLDETVEHYLRLVGLWEEVMDRLDAPAAKLSIGQQQRLCLARGLSVEPEVLLCDEPTSSLDPISAQHIERRLMEIKKDYTIVLVTHVLRQAQRLADYVVFLYMGTLVEHGPAPDFFEHPREPRTQAYLSGEFS